MLYVSTRNKVDSFTAYRVLRSEAAPDGGIFMPLQLPALTDVQLAELEQMNFSQAISYIINLFFGTKITGWDVDFSVGRQAVTLGQIGHKVSVSENWHNPAGEYDYFVRRLFSLVCGEKHPKHKPNFWFYTACDIAILFATHGRFCRRDIFTFDIAVQTGDLRQLLAVRYAQKMGLPIEGIVLGCMDGDNLWEFFTYGDYPAGRRTMSAGLEALLWLEFGYPQVQSYLAVVEQRGIYKLDALSLEQLRKDLFAAVVGDGRVKDVVTGANRNAGYIMETATARAFGALQDYRAKTGENKTTLLLADRTPEDSKRIR